MRLKVPFYGFVLAGLGFAIPLLVLAALLPALVNAEPVKERFIEELESWTGAKVELNGPVAIESFFSLSFNAEDVEFDGFRGLPSLKTFKAGQIVARIAWIDLLAGNLDFDKIKVYNALIRLGPTDRRQARDILVAAWAAPYRTPFDALMLRDSHVEIEKVSGGLDRLEIRRFIAELDQTTYEVALSGGILWNGESVNLDIETEALPRRPRDATIPVRVDIDSRLLKSSFDGQTEPSAGWKTSGSFEASSANLAELISWLDLPANPAATAGSLAGQLELAGSRVSLEAGRFSLAGAEASGDLTLFYAGATPKLEGSLAFNELDAGAFWALNGRKAEQAEPRKGALMDILQRARLDLRVSANRMRWNELSLGAAAFTLTGADRLFSAEIAHLEFFGGSLLGRVELDLQADLPRARARVTAQNVDVAQPMDAIAQQGWLTGQVDADVHAQTFGLTLEQFIDGLTVEARLAFPAGGQIRLDPAQLVRSANEQMLSGWNGADLSWQDFSEMRLRLIYRKDHLRCRDLYFLSGSQLVQGSGQVDFANRDLNWILDVLPAGRAASLTGSVPNVSSDTAAIPEAKLSISGPWASPAIRSSRRSGQFGDGASKARHAGIASGRF